MNPKRLNATDVATSWTDACRLGQLVPGRGVAVLLPDGRVLSAGGGRPKAKNGGANNSNCEIFEPPYLFKGNRPEVTQVPAKAGLGQQIEVTTPDAANIAQVTLVRLGSVRIERALR